MYPPWWDTGHQSRAGELLGALLTPLCSCTRRGEGTAKSAPSHKEEKFLWNWKIAPWELRNLNSESLKKLTATENLKHRQIKRPCPKPVQESASEMDIESSDNQTQDFFFFLIWCTRKYKPFLYHQKFHKAGPLMTILQSTILRP